MNTVNESNKTTSLNILSKYLVRDSIMIGKSVSSTNVDFLLISVIER